MGCSMSPARRVGDAGVRGAGSPGGVHGGLRGETAPDRGTCPPKTYLVPMSRLWPRNRLSSSRSSDSRSMGFGHRGGHARPTDVLSVDSVRSASRRILAEAGRVHVFAGMDRNNGGASVRVLVMMAAARSDRFETQPFQRPDQLATGDAGQSGVTGDADALDADELVEVAGRPSTSRHGAIASWMRKP